MSRSEAAQPTAFTPHLRNQDLGPLTSRKVVPDEISWSESYYPGVHYKTLMVDPKGGQLTVLLKMDPGAELPDHEHVMIEQTYVLEGFLEDKEGPDKGLRIGPGEFVWRPAGSRHAAWTPEGGLMVAFFMMPNKFFEGEEVVDFLGKDWEKSWGHAMQ